MSKSPITCHGEYTVRPTDVYLSNVPSNSPRLDSGKARERGQGGAILDGFFRLHFSRKRVSQGPRNQTIRQGNLIIGS